MNAAFIGAGFLAGTLATGLVLRVASRWRTFSTLPTALWVLATSLLAATIIHEDRFKWDYPPTWVWTFVYAVVPLAVPFLVCRQRARRRRRSRRPTHACTPLRDHLGDLRRRAARRRDRALRRSRSSSASDWPWPLTPLLARAVAAWYALFGDDAA